MTKTTLFDQGAAQEAQLLQQGVGGLVGTLRTGLETAKLGYVPTTTPGNTLGGTQSSDTPHN
ncbi:MAG: hypothetical protein A3I77_05815 [Gammaproteobacteria bacterium RIFCSPLOWO2_02_FULL_42_14]|nr:MAG: hypothetical protein A3B71_02085 [Gammaproteobacteria bacterium RIFCSPHIGHO2_02_FULL_42_43]OGT27964.1 MAG: hypothetical protein A2624_04995 [Gammaproteobacteria bacterium RIFCSPHIGHO2_01_FULL_42_8]OGT53389.1 MAG: hypothetical protein A3E54_06690 [Gammaproteobacteria bacterium RIFCSPHIGHO2_12_FULL_41_25]OGT63415.1 MAG: hypothetical protein A3I77_05815 [Gammaproteobacteria bacterium RIFCSPLOWO2_02_FULL_42_14]OGT87341.1 MAG: hypothetical protein A3G86_00260 [Gammaproteobacteria bacterium R